VILFSQILSQLCKVGRKVARGKPRLRAGMQFQMKHTPY